MTVTRWVGLAVVALLLLAAPEAKAGLAVTQVERSVVPIVTAIVKDHPRAGERGFAGWIMGTGFVVDTEGDVVTNAHVVTATVEPLPRGTHLGPGVVLDGGITRDHQRPYALVWVSPGDDLAIIRVPDLHRPPLTLATADPAKGETVWALGFPGAADRGRNPIISATLGATLTEGIVERVTKEPWRPGSPVLPIIQHQATLNSGNSGGPLLDGCGEVVGVNTEIAAPDIDRGEFPAGLNYASGVSALVAALKQKGVDFNQASETCAVSAAGSGGHGQNFILFAALLLAIAALMLALRKPRQVLAGAVERLSQRYDRPAPERPQSSATKVDWVLTGPGLRVPLGEALRAAGADGLIIGRDQNIADIVVAGATVSRCHARLIANQGGIAIEDMGSPGGTALDSRKLAPFTPEMLGASDHRLDISNVALQLARSKEIGGR